MAENHNAQAQFILSKFYESSSSTFLYNNGAINLRSEKIKFFHGITNQAFQIIQSSLPAIKDDFTPLLEITSGKSSLLKCTTTNSELFSLSQGIIMDQDSQKLFDNHEIFSNLEKSNIYLEILSEQLSMIFDFQNLKPTKDLHSEIQEALKSYIPIEKLKLVFKKFGNYVHTKLIFGNKLQRIILKEDIKRQDGSAEFNDFSEIEKWKELVQPFDTSFMIAMDGYPIELSQIPKWLDVVSNQESEWYIVKRVVVPLYKILDVNQQHEIENLFKMENFVLMSNITLLSDYSSGYHRIEYDSPLKSDNYQLFGSVTCDGERLENIYVKFNMKTEYGFSVSWHDKSTFDRKPHALRWILIGCPSEIGYFDPKTRNISVILGVKEIKLTETVKINVEKSNIVTFNIEYVSIPTSSFFRTNIVEKQKAGSIEVKIEAIKEEEDTQEEEENADEEEEDTKEEEKDTEEGEVMEEDVEKDASVIDEDDFIRIRWCILNLKKHSEINDWKQLGECLTF
ncbi:182_t:CDS:2 [Ambispora leptoticha]|uniref:182_t:CDS:1 n=1 Tax=Ambispora leptoticha TaxID=144679 RepID=A0A9N9G5G7_9GLOM|nr:182_t:CDS:2 [Ambispora leptoticha]